MVDSCGKCTSCQEGEEQYCEEGNIPTYAGVDKYGDYTQGGYSTHIVVTEGFVVRIPDNIPFDAAAPLLCAGITTYSPLKRWQAGEGKKSSGNWSRWSWAFRSKDCTCNGCRSNRSFTNVKKKQEDGLAFGAKEYYATNDEETLTKLAGSFDFILNTVSAKLDMSAYLNLLALNGTLVNVGAPSEPLDVNAFSLISKRRSFAGSMIGGIRETQEMLDFCSAHSILPEIEVISADKIDDAYERVLHSDVRYRFVIDTSTI